MMIIMGRLEKTGRITMRDFYENDCNENFSDDCIVGVAFSL